MRYLIVGPSWVGDMVMAQSLFKALHVDDDKAEISVLAPVSTYPLLSRMPEVKAAILSPITHGKLGLQSHRTLGKSLRGQFDQAIVLPGSLKSSLIPFFAKVPQRTGWKGEMRYRLINDMRHLDELALPLMVDQYLALSVDKDNKASTHVNPSLQVDNDNIKNLSAQLDLRQDKKILAFCPGAEYGTAKQWPAEHFVSLAKEKITEGWQVWIFGGPKDVGIAETISGKVNSDNCVSLAGKTKLLDAVDLLSLADTVVSNDSGLMHVSCALGKNVVVIYGSSTPSFTPPLSNSAKALSLNLACSPCFKRECPLTHLNCLKQLDARQVDAAVNSFYL